VDAMESILDGVDRILLPCSSSGDSAKLGAEDDLKLCNDFPPKIY